MHTIDDRLRALGDALLRENLPITIDEIRDGCGPLLSVPDVAEESGDVPPARRSLRLIWTAAAAVLAVVLVVVATRGSERTPSAAPSSDGRMLLDATVEGWALVGLNDSLVWGRTSRSHLYVDITDPTRAIQVQAFDADYMSPDLGGSRSVTLRDGRTAEIVNVPSLGGRSVAYEDDGVWVTVNSNAVADDVLFEMAGAVMRSEELTASIPPELIPPGFEDRGIVRQGEPNFVTDDAGEGGGPTMRWENGERSFWVYSVPGPESAEVMVAFKSNLEMLDVRGAEGAAFSLPEQPSFQGLAWVESERSFFAASNELTRHELAELVEGLRPVSIDEWDRAIASIAPPVAVLDAGAGLPAPGSLVPTRVTLFPYLPDSAVPARGGGPTYANYGYSPAGVEIPGSWWIGAIGPAGTAGSGDDILITVANPALDALFRPPTVDGRFDGVSEYEWNGGAELYLDRDGVSISVQGSDKDLLYSVIDLVQPIIDEGQLNGYELVGDLPADLAVTAAPYGYDIETGSMPSVRIVNTLSLTIDRAPLSNLLARQGKPFELVSTPLGDTWLSTQEISEVASGTLHTAFVTLADGTTLTAQSEFLTRDEFLAAIGSVQFIDRAEWEAIYRPTPAIIPRQENTTASTVTEQT